MGVAPAVHACACALCWLTVDPAGSIHQYIATSLASMVHPGPHAHVSEEGPFSASSSRLPVLHYYPVRGRAEPIRCTHLSGHGTNAAAVAAAHAAESAERAKILLAGWSWPTSSSRGLSRQLSRSFPSCGVGPRFGRGNKHNGAPPPATAPPCEGVPLQLHPMLLLYRKLAPFMLAAGGSWMATPSASCPGSSTR